MAARKKSSEEAEYELLKANTRELLKTSAGKSLIWHVLSICNLYGESFTGNSSTFYNEGKRAVGLEILQLLEDADKLAYATLLLAKQKEIKT